MQPKETITIKELAEEFQVSKQAIRKQLTETFRANYVQSVTRNGVPTLLVDHEGYLLLKQHFQRDKPQGTAPSNKEQTVPASALLPFFERQLQEKDDQIRRLQNLLDHQQQLTLQANQHLETLQKQLQGTSDEASKDRPSTEPTDAKQPARKWWAFWQ